MPLITADKRIAINTLVLYLKLIFVIAVSFLTSRLVLQALGASDYGLYNVVGGIVALFNTFGTSMVATSYRYMAVEIGKGKDGNPNMIYNTILLIHICLAVFLIFIGESIGVFYINNYLNVDISKIPDALFVLHTSLITSAFFVLTIPMNGLIIARENFLFISIIDVLSALLKIVLVFTLLYIESNKIRSYAIFMAVVQLFSPIAYQVYCFVKDKNTIKWNFNRSKSDYIEILKFTSWMFIGATAVMGQVQGAAMIINLFFGTILNAAFGLASQVQSAIMQFTTTLRQAFIPQIMKNQKSNEGRSLDLVYAISRYSYLCMSFLIIPIILCLDSLLRIWLVEPPRYTNLFIYFMLISGLISNLAAGFDASIQATGKVKVNQIGYSLINLSLLPFMAICYQFDLPPYSNVIIMVLLAILTVAFQCYIMKKLTAFCFHQYLRITVQPAIVSSIIAFVPLYVLRSFIGDSILPISLFLCFGFGWSLFTIFLFGLNLQEKKIVSEFVNRLLVKII